MQIPSLSSLLAPQFNRVDLNSLKSLNPTSNDSIATIGPSGGSPFEPQLTQNGSGADNLSGVQSLSVQIKVISFSATLERGDKQDIRTVKQGISAFKLEVRQEVRRTVQEQGDEIDGDTKDQLRALLKQFHKDVKQAFQDSKQDGKIDLEKLKAGVQAAFDTLSSGVQSLLGIDPNAATANNGNPAPAPLPGSGTQDAPATSPNPQDEFASRLENLIDKFLSKIDDIADRLRAKFERDHQHDDDHDQVEAHPETEHQGQVDAHHDGDDHVTAPSSEPTSVPSAAPESGTSTGSPGAAHGDQRVGSATASYTQISLQYLSVSVTGQNLSTSV